MRASLEASRAVRKFGGGVLRRLAEYYRSFDRSPRSLTGRGLQQMGNQQEAHRTDNPQSHKYSHPDATAHRSTSARRHR
jgi:hypothetical protein